MSEDELTRLAEAIRRMLIENARKAFPNYRSMAERTMEILLEREL